MEPKNDGKFFDGISVHYSGPMQNQDAIRFVVKIEPLAGIANGLHRAISNIDTFNICEMIHFAFTMLRGYQQCAIEQSFHDYLVSKSKAPTFRPVSRDFILAMIEGLIKGQGAGRNAWENHEMQDTDYEFLASRMLDELGEMTQAVKSIEKDPDCDEAKMNLRREAADVANFCMFIAEKFNTLEDDDPK